mgnify:CR=1 FL=1
MIKVEGLTKRYGEAPAVDSLDLQVRAGEILAVSSKYRSGAWGPAFCGPGRDTKSGLSCCNLAMRRACDTVPRMLCSSSMLLEAIPIFRPNMARTEMVPLRWATF